jgi:ribonuclease P protein component
MLKVRGEISRGFKLGDKVRGKYLTIIAMKPGTLRKPRPLQQTISHKYTELTKIAVLTTKKCGRAVARNHLKRITREYFRLHQHYFQNFEAVIFSIDKEVLDEAEYLRELELLSLQVVKDSTIIN